MSDENPYAPPTVDEPMDNPALPWRVDGDSLLVKHGTTLPQVDLPGGATEDLVVVKRSYHPIWLRNLVPIAFLGCLFLKRVVDVPTGKVLLAAVLISIAAQASGILGVKKFRQWYERASEKRRRRRNGLRLLLVLVGIGLVFSPVILVIGGSPLGFWLWALMATGMLVWLGAGLAGIHARRKPEARGAGRGWVRVGPVHPRALRTLREMQRQAETELRDAS